MSTLTHALSYCSFSIGRMYSFKLLNASKIGFPPKNIGIRCSKQYTNFLNVKFWERFNSSFLTATNPSMSRHDNFNIGICDRKVSSFCNVLKASAITLQGERVFEEYATLSQKLYKDNQDLVDEKIKKVLRENRVVLFMEGTVDSPKSLLSMNIVRILQQIQLVPLVTVDLLQHPSIFGYVTSHSRGSRGPLLFVDGTYFGGHDSILSLFSSGVLASRLGKTSITKVNLTETLPIALY